MTNPLSVIRNIHTILVSSATSVRKLLESRLISSAYQETIDRYSYDIWAKILTERDIYNAFRIANAYVVEKAYYAKEFYHASEEVEEEVRGQMVRRMRPNAELFTTRPDVADYDFEAQFIFMSYRDGNANGKKKIDDFFIRLGLLNTEIQVYWRDENNNNVLTPMTVLEYVVGAQDIERFRYLISKNVNVLNRPYLLIAARFQSVEIARTLVQAGADVNVVNSIGENALFKAIGYFDDEDEEPEMFKYLLKVEGIDREHLNNNGDAIIHRICSSGTTLEVFLEPLLEAGADVNQPNSRGSTGIMFAVESATSFIDEHVEAYYGEWRGEHYGGEEIVKMMLTYGADISLVNQSNMNVFHYSAQSFYITKMLIDNAKEKGLDVPALLNTQDINGDTPLHYIAEHADHYPFLIELFIFEGADVNVTNGGGVSARDLMTNAFYIKVLERIQMRRRTGQRIDEISQDEKDLDLINKIGKALNIEMELTEGADVHESLLELLYDDTIPSKDLIDFDPGFGDLEYLLQLFGARMLRGTGLQDNIQAFASLRDNKLAERRQPKRGRR